MNDAFLTDRVKRLEEQVNELVEWRDSVRSLGSQISQFQAEVRAELLAVRQEIRAGDEETRRHVDSQVETLRVEIRAGDEETRRHVDSQIETLRVEIRAGDEETRRHVVETLRAEIRAGDEASQRFMRALYEELRDLIRTLGEGGGSERSKKR